MIFYLSVAAMYHRFNIRFKTWDISNMPGILMGQKKVILSIPVFEVELHATAMYIDTEDFNWGCVLDIRQTASANLSFGQDRLIEFTIFSI